MSMEVRVRVLRPEDLAAIVDIDRKVNGTARQEYYQHKLAVANLQEAQINASLVAEADGKVVGFLMGTLFLGEFGIPETSASIDTVGVDPDCQDRGIAGTLFDQFRSNMRAARVSKVYTMVDWNDFGLLKFFGNMGFVPSQRLSLDCSIY